MEINNYASGKKVRIQLDNGSGGLHKYMQADANAGNLKLYNSGSLKLETTAYGTTVTGTLNADSATISGDITSKTGDGALLKLQTSETTVVDGDIIGAIEFSAPNEASGGDAIANAAEIVAEANGTFSSTINNTDLVFKTGYSTPAAEHMRLTGLGDLEVKAGDGAILKLQTSDTTVSIGSVLGAIEFSAPDEGSGTDAITTAAKIWARSAQSFSSSGNSTDLIFALGTSGTATEMMRLTHDGDLEVKAGDGAILKLQTTDTSVVDGDVLGAIEFNAPDEASGTDAITTAASIVAEADAGFGATQNNTDLVFKLGTSGAAAEKARLTHEGNLSATSFSGDGSALTNLPETGDGGIAMAIALG